MKTKVTMLGLLSCLALGLLTLVGCASLGASNQESLLTAAGFQVHVPQTAKQKELYAAAPSYKVMSFTMKDKVLYAYKDEKKGVAYVGGPKSYQHYQQLLIQQSIADQNYQAAVMNSQMSYGWYGAYGPVGYRRGMW